jgi:hypothetical protein
LLLPLPPPNAVLAVASPLLLLLLLLCCSAARSCKSSLHIGHVASRFSHLLMHSLWKKCLQGSVMIA